MLSEIALTESVKWAARSVTSAGGAACSSMAVAMDYGA
jgi:hypothetical protein